MARRFTKDFKVHAVKLVIKEKLPVKTVAEKLELDFQTLYRWIDEFQSYGDDAFVGSGKLHQQDKEILKLKKKNERLKVENEILKKGQAYLAHLKKLN